MNTTTILLIVSRPDFLTEVISALELMECDATRTNILCIVDGDAALFMRTRNLIQNTKFNERLTLRFPATTKVRRFNITARRQRITELHQFAQRHILDAEYILSVEDDTIVPPHTLTYLQASLRLDPSCAVVEGVELGRWGIPYVGAWVTDDIYDPQIIRSVENVTPARGEHRVDAVDAGGLYCALIRGDVYRRHDFDQYDNLGPDINLGIVTRQLGHAYLIDWNVRCTHLTLDSGGNTVRITPDLPSQQVTLKKHNKVWDIEY